MKKRIYEKIKKAFPFLLACLCSFTMIFAFLAWGGACADKAVTASASSYEAYPTANLLSMSNQRISYNGSYKNTPLNYKLTSGKQYTLSFFYTVYKAEKNGVKQRMYCNVGYGSTKTAFTKSVKFSAYPVASSIEYGEKYYYTVTFTAPTVTTQYLCVRFADMNGVSSTVDILIEDITLNAGATAYPYSPSFDSVYNEGYTEGEADGLETAKYGVLSNATFYLSGNFDGTALYFDMPVDLEVGKVSFQTIANQLASYQSVTNLKMFISFDPAIPWNLIDLQFYGNSSIFPCLSDPPENKWVVSSYYKSTSHTLLELGLVYNEKGYYEFNHFTINSHLDKSLYALYDIGASRGINISTLSNLCSFYIMDGVSSAYYKGYNDGVASGDAYGDGYEDGNADGYKEGYVEGLAKGQSEDPYDLNAFIFAIVDAPFKVIREAFNFEVLGFDLSALILFLITAFVCIFVIKKLKGG